MQPAHHAPLIQLRNACAAWLLASAVATVAALGASPANAADPEIAGVKLTQSLQLAGNKLLLNGAGVRYRGPFRVYTAALYTTDKVGTEQEFLANTGAKRLEITMLREVDSAQLGRLFISGVQKNMAPGDMIKVMLELPRMGEIFSDNKSLLPGEQLVIDWLPGQGMQITVRGKVQGEVFKSPEFFGALMKIWLGKSPADGQLKDALLGKSDTDRAAKS